MAIPGGKEFFSILKPLLGECLFPVNICTEWNNRSVLFTQAALVVMLSSNITFRGTCRLTVWIQHYTGIWPINCWQVKFGMSNCHKPDMNNYFVHWHSLIFPCPMRTWICSVCDCDIVQSIGSHWIHCHTALPSWVQKRGKKESVVCVCRTD